MKFSLIKTEKFPLYSYISSYRATYRYLPLMDNSNRYLFDRYLMSLLVCISWFMGVY